MKTLRLIKFSNEDGSRESVFFTEDFESDAADFVPSDCTLDDDVQVNVSGWPDAFPLEYELKRN